MAGDRSTAALRVGSRRLKGRRRSSRRIKGAVDLISSLPDVILQDILTFVPTKLAIRTSLLSKRWRHVWCNISSLSFDYDRLDQAYSISETLTHYTALKMMKFHLHTTSFIGICKWIKFVMSRNVEKISLDLTEYNFPDFFYINTSVKKLSIRLSISATIPPRCSVSWTSLQKLYLRHCFFTDESIAKILSGCPILESLKLDFYSELRILDLSKSMRLRTLEINESASGFGPTQIVAPYLHCLVLTSTKSSLFTLVDVSSLAEAKLTICISPFQYNIEADILQNMVLKLLKELQNVEKLTFEEILLQVLSLAELLGVPLPMFKVKALTLKTSISRNVIIGIERILQNSPDLKTLTKVKLDEYVASQGLNPDQCWRSKDGANWNRSRWKVKPKHVVSFMRLMLKNTKKLEKMVVLLEEYPYSTFRRLIPNLAHGYNRNLKVFFFLNRLQIYSSRFDFFLNQLEPDKIGLLKLKLPS
ncbi:PREDICTED: putative F-box/LRR-repeat protein At3g18150 [Camelina sativa]|uniref:F-box/LRR-repeat protein At3g18150 n=1 Tax=Camelina sativa TaxID=90675 RepID=A0ABM1RBL3_CAMSA|nr:PREDICTED: putative F-box/LRR-repeat protein At3g18150 [Camelina sativa]